jgi:ubiquinone biosynthesis protein
LASILTTVRDLERLRQIVVVLGRHGFGEIVQRIGLGSLARSKSDHESEEPAKPSEKVSPGERIRLVVQDLGPSFVKLGQIVSTRPDVIPEEIIRELKKLQDEVPPVPFAELRDHVEAELGAPIAECFDDFHEEPLASASIGQVHRAKLKTAGGFHEVVVKIQRPNIKNTIERDIDLLYFLARTLERSVPESRIYSPVKMVEEFDRAITAELDFQLEADHAERFRQNFDDDPIVRFPLVYRNVSSRRVLTMEFLDGKKVYEAVRAGASGAKIAKNAVHVTVKMIFEHGFFHADPHPGNVLILGPPSDPLLALVDLGLVGRLTPRMRDRTVELMVAAVRKDYRGMADALYHMGKATRKVDRNAFEAEVALLADKYLGKKLGEIEGAALLRDLVYGAQKFGLEIPADFLMVGKALMTIEGVGKEIYPELDLFEEIKPYFLELLKQRYSPERITNDLMTTALRLSQAANDLPVQLEEIMNDLRSGSLRIQVHEPGREGQSDRLGRRVFSASVVASSILGCAVLLAGDHLAGAILFAVFGAIWTGGHVLVSRRRRVE